MGRLLRLLVIFLLLGITASLAGWAAGWTTAGPVAAAGLSVLVALGAAVLKRRPGFSRAMRRRLFARAGD